MQSFVLYMFICGCLANIYVLYNFFSGLFLHWRNK